MISHLTIRKIRKNRHFDTASLRRRLSDNLNEPYTTNCKLKLDYQVYNAIFKYRSGIANCAHFDTHVTWLGSSVVP